MVDPPASARLAARLNSVAVHVVRRARAADRESGVPSGQFSALSVLVFGGDRTVAELAAAEQVTSPTMTRIVDGLERSGLARRRRHPDDARSTLVAATGPGREVMEAGRRRRVAVLLDLVGQLDPEDAAALDQALDALARALDGDR